MKCYYEELGVEREANENDIKTAYRKLALKWHPDKNPDCMQKAKERFQIIQQAYDVLSDPQERIWYDKHRDQILRGKNSTYEDRCLDVFQFFTISSFIGYGDDAKGFYAVYRDVFEKIIAEDVEFMDEADELDKIPQFGDSQSSYEEVVSPFYAYWNSYCTKKTYTWLCPYDIKEIKDRRILREIERNLKKVVQKAKKERNEEVRALVSFIRKRDKRVHAYKQLLDDRAALNRQKQEQNRLEQIRRRHQELEEMRQKSEMVNNIQNDDYEEQLKQLEQQYSSGDEYIEEDNLVAGDLNKPTDFECEESIIDLYCVACNKEFKSERAFLNHEASRKHRDNVTKLKKEINDEENIHANYQRTEENRLEMLDENIECNDTERIDPEIKYERCKSKYKKNAQKLKQSNQINFGDEFNNEENGAELVAKTDILDFVDKDNVYWHPTSKKVTKKSKNKNKANKHPLLSEQQILQPNSEIQSIPNEVLKSSIGVDNEKTQHTCATCKSKFESKNKLFSHLKLQNHGVYIPKPKVKNDEYTNSMNIKGKRK